MDDTQQPTAVPDDEVVITLGLLNAVADSNAVTQRSMAGKLGIALGLTNAYLKRCIKKGLIKVSQAPANRYAYYLTPWGFAEKSRLTAEYLSISFNFFRAARRDCSEVFAACVANGWRRILLAGGGDLAEIATLCVSDHELKLVGVLDPACMAVSYGAIPVFADLTSAAAHDAVMITDLATPQGVFDSLTARMPAERVVVPRILNVSRVRPKLAE